MMYRKWPLQTPFLGVLITLSATAAAESARYNASLDDRLTLRAGGVYAEPDGSFRSTRQGNPETELDLGDFGLDDGEWRLWLAGRLRLGQRWRLDASYMNIDNDSSGQGALDFNFGDLIIPVDADVATSLEADIYLVNLGFAIVRTPRVEIGLGLGAHVFDASANVSATLDTNTGPIDLGSDSADATAPLPNVHAFADFALTPKLALMTSGGWLDAEYEDYDGQIWTARANLEYRILESAGIGVGVNFIDVDIDDDDGSKTSRYDVELPGVLVYFTLGF